MRLKSYVYIGLGVSFGLIVLYLLYIYFTTGFINVKASQSDQVFISKVDGQEIVSSHTGKYKSRLKVGEYEVTIKNSSKAKKKIVKIRSAEETTVAMALEELKFSKYISLVGGHEFSVNGNSITYVDDDSKLLRRISDRVNESNVYDSNLPYEVVDVAWGINGSGIVILENRGKSVYLISGDKLQKINVQGDPNSVDITDNGDYLVSTDSGVYITKSGKTERLLNNGLDFSEFKLSQKNVIYSNITSSKEKNAVYINEISSKRSKEFQKNGSDWEWSPDGDKITYVDGSKLVLSNANFENEQIISQGSSFSQWLTNSSVVFNQGNELWTYDLKDKISTKIVEVEPSKRISGLYSSGSLDDIYIMASDGEMPAIYKITNTKSARNIQALEEILPLTDSSFEIEFQNIGKPKIIIRTPEYSKDLEFDRKSALNYLESYKFDLTGVSIEYSFIEEG